MNSSIVPGLVYGIDFGTWNSSVMVGTPDGARPIKPRGAPFSDFSMPSAVWLSDDGGFDVGYVANRRRGGNAERYHRGFKEYFGEPAPLWFGAGSNEDDGWHQVTELVAAVLTQLRLAARSEVPGTPERVAITVPASWEQEKRELMRRTAADAGFDPERLELIPEPVAAVAYAYHRFPTDSTQTVLVYDLGGGTFDCAVARSTRGGGYRVLGRPAGLADVGGHAFDRSLLAIMCQRSPSIARLMDEGQCDPDTLGRRLSLLDAAEQVKVALSEEDLVERDIYEVSPRYTLRISRAEFEDLIRAEVDKTVVVCEEMLRSNELCWTDVDRIVRAGGASNMPLVGELLSRRSARPVVRLEHPELAVVHGAVLMAQDKVRELRRQGTASPPVVPPTPPRPLLGRDRPAGPPGDAGVDPSAPAPALPAAAAVTDERQVRRPPAARRGPDSPTGPAGPATPGRATTARPKVVGQAKFVPAGSGSLVFTITFWVGWAATAGYLAVTDWPGYWGWAHAGTGLVILGSLLVSATRRSEGAAWAAVFVCLVLHAPFPLVALVIYLWRILVQHQGVGALPPTLAGLGLLACVPVLFGAAVYGLDIEEEQTSLRRRDEDRAVRDKVETARWIGPGAPPDLLADLLRTPAARGFPLKDPFFDYAVARGATVGLIRARVRPPTAADFQAATERWSKLMGAAKAGGAGSKPTATLHYYVVAEAPAQRAPVTGGGSHRRDQWPVAVTAQELVHHLGALIDQAPDELFLPALRVLVNHRQRG